MQMELVKFRCNILGVVSDETEADSWTDSLLFLGLVGSVEEQKVKPSPLKTKLKLKLRPMPRSPSSRGALPLPGSVFDLDAEAELGNTYFYTSEDINIFM